MMKLASPHDRADAYLDRKVVTHDLAINSPKTARSFQMAHALVDAACKPGANAQLAQLTMGSARTMAKLF